MAHRRNQHDPVAAAERLVERDLTALAREGRLGPVHGQDERVAELLALLSGKAKHPVLVGEPGVGKSALVREVARRLAASKEAHAAGMRVVEISLAGVLARVGPRQAPDALETLFQHLGEQDGCIVALRDVAVAIDGPLAPVLGAALRAGAPRFLLELDARDVAPLLRSEETLGDLLHLVIIPEPSPERARWILGQVAETLEAELHLPIDPAACDLVLRLSTRFLLSRRLPRKAIELLEETAQEVSGAGRDRLVPEDVLARFCSTTRLPRFVVDDSVALDVEETERFFSERLLGQEEAIQAVLRSVALLKAGLNDPRRPLGVFLFAGPTGVGKTHLAKLVAEYLFGSADRLVRLNMADLKDDGDETLPFGSPWADNPARSRGELARQLDGKVFAVLLLDEFEKANRSVHDRFLQLFDEGRFVNAAGETISCANTLIIATSNVGAEVYREHGLGFGGAPSEDELVAEVDRRIAEAFRHEFLNRFDAICHFHPLGKEEIRRIAQREVGRVMEREGITARALDVELAPAVLDLLVDRGHSPQFGARYLQREIEKSLTTALAIEIARKPLPKGTRVRVDVAAHGRIVAKADAVLPTREATAQLVLPSTRALGVKRRLDRRSLLAEVNTLTTRARKSAETAGRGELEVQRRELLAKTQAPDLWDEPVTAAETLRAFRRVEGILTELERIAQACSFAKKVVREAKGEAQVTAAARQVEDVARQVQLAEAMAASGATQADGDETLLDLSALEDGDSGAAWVDELAAMYAAWAERRGYGCEVIAEAEAPERRVLRLEGPGVRGFLAGEVGVHRRVLEAARVRAHVRLLSPPSGEADGVSLSSREVRRRAGRAVPKLEAEVIARHAQSGRVLSLSGARPLEELERLAALLVATPVDAREEARRYFLGRSARVEDPRTGVGTPRIKDVLRGDIDVFLTAWISRAQGGEAASHFFNAR